MNIEQKLAKNQKLFKEWNEQYKSVLNSSAVQKEIDNLHDVLDPFFQKIKIISEKYNISNEHAACHICNYGDEYICKKFNGGCEYVATCQMIQRGSSEMKLEDIE